MKMKMKMKMKKIIALAALAFALFVGTAVVMTVDPGHAVACDTGNC